MAPISVDADMERTAYVKAAAFEPVVLNIAVNFEGDVETDGEAAAGPASSVDIMTLDDI